ncbi:unnamed protein product [Adineta steineri]|uniref:Uncharacterized protein n=1 Tax=Adineta steineri TaxID=433720 RepID=A0A813TXF9_9BILA|nr:unnamed protein product [Adineta steineri]CAF1299774.1 unnamed protein product [Adineta steineri]CAF3871298.1 unnamed protein product [Adineta steineri]
MSKSKKYIWISIAVSSQTIKLGGTTLYVGNFQAAFKNPTGVGVPPVDDEKRGVPSTDEDGLGALRADEGKF